MDVQTRELRWWSLGLFAIVLLAIGLRLHGIHNPILDHPNWRQGDTASIARNFARLNYNILYPQTNYDGPPPNYVELELQIVPFLAASLYKIFGVHAIFGRLISLAFSVGCVAVVGLFARWLFRSSLAGLIAAFFFAVFPGSVYYGRTFTPDTTMVFFLTAALYATSRLLLEDETLAPRPLARAAALVVFAYLAKPVSVAGIVPILGVTWERLRLGKPTRPTALLVLLVVPLIILALYTQRVNAHAEWHWASAITTLHVIPALKATLTTGSGFALKWSQFVTVIGMLRDTMLGSVAFLLTIAGFIALPWLQARSKALLWGWLVGGLAYTYVVVTVERVDYYMYLLLPLCALVIGGALSGFLDALRNVSMERLPRYAAAALVPVAALASLVQGRAAVAPYYRYSAPAYHNAVILSKALAPKALVVMGHYGPDVLYYIDRYGWEEDPALWTPFDEESAIRKGARYFISVEDHRLRANADLCAWLQRFPLLQTTATWPVYVTDPAKELPGGEAFWRAYRTASARGAGRAFLTAHHRCMTRM
ncbi:MAG TPA: glycosyltransferase family 39 protein [Candidatus Dormibacteraeota bacterium]|nr:glycosyltransferase family 39 protein [Candidatus Dormibacteraeota bacterium]